MSDQPDQVREDRSADELFEPVAELIAQELTRSPGPERRGSVEEAREVADSITNALLERFVVRSRPTARVERRPAPADGDVILDVRELSVSYGARKAVDNVNFRIARGEIFGLLGPNGAGKTSTLSAIEGLVKPQAGAVFVDGIDVRRRPLEAKAKLGVQLQATSFQARLTIKQIARLYSGLYGVALTDDQIMAGLQEIGLGEEASKPFKQMSGGQQQRLSLYVAVVHDPVLLLLDEPTAGLDPQSRRQLWTRLEKIRQNGGSILLTTHSMEEAEAVCDRVAIIDHGAVLTCETPQDLIAKHRDDPEVRKVAHGEVTLEDVFIGLTGSEIRE